MSLMESHYLLTTPQQNIWNIQKYSPDTSIANVGGMLRFASVYNYEVFNRAINLLIENNDALRLRFFEENGQPYQIVTEYQPMQIAEHDVRGKNQSEIDSFFTAIVQTPFDFKHEPLYRFTTVNLDCSQCGIFICVHHLICDAWSMSVMAKEILKYYRQELSGGAVANPMPSFIDAITAEQSYLSSPQYVKDKTYWDATFAEKPQFCQIKDIKEQRDSRTARYTYEIDESMRCEMEAYCKQESITPVILFESALFAYLHRTNEYATPVTIGVPVLNRSTVIEKKTVGMFISTMPLSVPVDENASMAELCQAIKQKHMESFKHQKYPISHILQRIRA